MHGWDLRAILRCLGSEADKSRDYLAQASGLWSPKEILGLGLGQSYGWVPAGAEYSGSGWNHAPEESRKSYDPDEWLYARRVTADDAVQWAVARARPPASHYSLAPFCGIFACVMR
jgi:hypothetical protein